MDDEVLVALLRDRFDSIDRRLDQQRAAIEMFGSEVNKVTVHITKQDGRIKAIEKWIGNRRHGVERQEDALQHRLGRWATLFSGLLGGLVAYGLVLLTGAH